MKPPAFVWRGHKNLEAGRDEWMFDDELIVTVPFTGPFGKCLSARPKKGQQLAGFSELGLKVKNSKISRLDGDAGELLITLSASLPPSEWQFADDEAEPPEDAVPIAAVRFALTFRSIEKDIHSLPQCGTISEAGILRGVTWDDWPEIEVNASYYQPSGAEDAWTYRDYVDLRAAGIESKLVFYPVVTRTIEFAAGVVPPDVGAQLGMRVDPPEKFGLPASWQWLCTGDGLEPGDKNVRTTEWTGAEKVNALLYPAP